MRNLVFNYSIVFHHIAREVYGIDESYCRAFAFGLCSTYIYHRSCSVSISSLIMRHHMVFFACQYSLCVQDHVFIQSPAARWCNIFLLSFFVTCERLDLKGKPFSVLSSQTLQKYEVIEPCLAGYPEKQIRIVDLVGFLLLYFSL